MFYVFYIINENFTNLNVHGMSAHMTFNQKNAARNENGMRKPKKKKCMNLLLYKYFDIFKVIITIVSKY